MIWFIIEVIILIILMYNMIDLLLNDTMNMKENFLRYLELTIYFVIMLLVTFITAAIIF